MIPAVGQKVGPYEILGRLGSGGMGLVFSAWDSRLQREVAIKLLRDEFAMPDMRERFLHEARAASGLNHPNICTIFDLGEQDGDPYLVMELLRGETLRSHIFSGAMPAEEIVHTGIEVADALAAAHARGIIHRDVKPANIFLVTKPGGHWQTKVLDFGLAKMKDMDSLDAKVAAGPKMTVGTVSYMSPEQARGEQLDARSDLFSLGIVLHEMATGHVPFRGATSALVFVQLLSHPAEPVRELNADIPKDLERIIFKLLKKDRGERYQSAEALRDALRKVVLKKPAGQKMRLGGWGRGAAPGVSFVPADDGSEEEAGVGSSAVRPAVNEDSVLRPVRRMVDDGSRRRPVAEEASGVVDLQGAAETETEDAESFAARSAHGDARREGWVHSRWFPPGVLVVLAFLGYGIAHWMGTRVAPTASRLPTVMLASVVNHTQEAGLDGALLQALRFDLQQSPRLSVSSANEVDTTARRSGVNGSGMAQREQAQLVASAAGATSFLLGEVRKDGSRYLLRVQVYDTATGSQLQQIQQSAADRMQVSKAVDKIVHDLRIAVGEPGDAVSRTTTPLAEDATANLDALSAFVAGQKADAAARSLDAQKSYARAVALDPKFTQAWLELADLYQREGAELGCADAANHAVAAAAKSSERTRMLAQAAQAMDSKGDFNEALKVMETLSGRYPRDLDVASLHATVLRMAGKMSESIDVAQDVLTRTPTDFNASGQAEIAMLELERPEAAARLEAEVARSGQEHAGLRFLIGFLMGKPGLPVQGLEKVPQRLRAQMYRAQVLDASGALPAGLSAWESIGMTSNLVPATRSGAATAMASAAMNRAVLGRCAESLVLARSASAMPKGPNATFAAGMAEGLCGDVAGLRRETGELNAKFGGFNIVTNLYLPQLKAVDQIQAKDVSGALATLQNVKQNDLLSLSPYLRATAHVTGKEWAPAIAEYQFILQHRGATTLECAPVYPMAQLGLARAYAASGDKGNSAVGYRAFADMWAAAPAGDPLLQEARKRAQ